MGRPYQCPKCKGTKTIWKGYRTRAQGKVRLRKCRACGRKFTTKQKIGNTARPPEPASPAQGDSPP